MSFHVKPANARLLTSLPDLRKHGSRLQLKSNWVIADRDNQLAYAKSIMKEPGIEASFTEIHTTAPKPQGLVEQISKLKSKGISPEEAEAVADTDYKKLIAALYRSVTEQNVTVDTPDALSQDVRRALEER